jgi:hypothetical protein
MIAKLDAPIFSTAEVVELSLARDYEFFSNMIRLVPVGFRRHPTARRRFSIIDVVVLRIVNGLSQYASVDFAGFVARNLVPRISEIAALDADGNLANELSSPEKQQFLSVTVLKDPAGDVEFGDDPNEPLTGADLASAIGPWPQVILPIDAITHMTVADCLRLIRDKANG